MCPDVVGAINLKRRTGTAFGVEVVIHDSQMTIKGSSFSSYQPISDESGRWLEQHFSNLCGSNVDLTLEAVLGLLYIAAELFDDSFWSEMSKYQRRNIQTRSVHNWCNFPADAECYEKHFRA